MRTPDHWQSNNLVSLLLRPFGWVYFFLGLLHRKIVRSVNIGVPVICIGNIVAGGAGKTPTVIYIGKLLSNSFRVAFLTRGYGGSLTGPVKVDPQKHTFHEVGDEAILLSRIATFDNITPSSSSFLILFQQGVLEMPIFFEISVNGFVTSF